MMKVKDKYQYQFVKKQLKPEYICLDIGANVGLFTVLMAKKCKQVYAFEPDHDNYMSLLSNAFGYDNCHMFNCAVTNYRGHVRLFKCEDSIGMHRIYPSKWCNLKKSVGVPCVDIDSLLDLKKKVDFVKIDVEGSEWGALEGMEKTIERFKPKMMIEFHPPSLIECDPASPKKIYDFLIKHYGKVMLMAKKFPPESKDISDISFDKLVKITSVSSSRNIFVC